MKNVKDFVRGEINVRVESLEIENFINLSLKNNIRMWNLKKENFTTITFTMFQDEYKDLKKIVRKTNSKTKILRKYGIHFLLNKINRRKFFLIGIGVFLFLILMFSSMILRIEVVGNKKIDNAIIIEALEKYGIKHGALKFGIDLREVERNVLRDLKEVSVVNVKFIGTKVFVDVIERAMPPEIDSIDVPRDIIATKEGVISKITALKGQKIVNIGDYIKKEDILIAGVIKDEEGIPIKVAEATGEVYAKVWYELEDNVDFKYSEEKLTGEEKEITYLKILDKKIGIKEKIEFEKYDKIEEIKEYNLFGYKVPIYKVKEIYKEKKVEKRTLNEKESLNILRNRIEENSKKVISKDGKIIDRIETIETTQNGVKLKVLYVVEENIGQIRDISPENMPSEEDKKDGEAGGEN